MTRTGYAFIVAAFAGWVMLGLLFSPGGAESAPAVESQGGGRPRKPLSVGHPTFVSPHASPIAISGKQVFVANTPSDTVDVIDAEKKSILSRVNVGIDPVSIAVRPDGKEVWVSNHVSDSVSVIDNDPDSPTYWNVVATIQEFDPKTKATTFDEPVGIAFAGNDKAYVALSSENQIAVIDVASRRSASDCGFRRRTRGPLSCEASGCT